MKKLFKKSIAMLIAVLMIVSSLPMTVLADTSSDYDAAKSAVNNFTYNGITAQQAEWRTNDNNSLVTMPDDTYRNTIYAANAADYGSFDNSSKYTKGYLHYQPVVFLYDGKTTPKAPIMVVYGNEHKRVNRYIGAIELSDAKGASSLSLIGNWHCSRNNSYGDNWDFTNVWQMNGSDDIQAGIDHNNPTNVQISSDRTGTQWDGWAAIPGHANMMEYNASFATGEYSQVITPQIDFYQGGNSPYTDVHDVITGTQNLYAVNYAAVLDRIDDAKTFMNAESADDYSESSMNAYIKAVNALVSFDVTTLSFAESTLADDVTNAGGTIGKLVGEYDTAKTNLEHKYTFNFIDGITTDVKYFKASDTVITPTNTAATEKVYKDETNHAWNTYSWVKTGDYTYTEKSNENLEAHNFADGKCTVCGFVKLDYTAYDAAVADLETELAKTDVYKADSIAAAQAVLDQAKADKENCQSQSTLEVITQSVVEAKDLLKLLGFKVTFVIDKDGVITETEDYYDYGTVLNLDANTDKVIKWTVEAQDGTTNLGTTAQAIDYVVARNAVVTVYVTDDADMETQQYSKVTFIGHNDTVVAVKYVKVGEPLATNDVAVPAISFYKTNGWDKASVTGTGSDITVRAKYIAQGTEKCNVVFGDFQKNYDYDTLVYLADADEDGLYAMYDADDNLLTYFVGKEFYAPHTDMVVIKAAESAQASSAITGFYQDGTKLVYNSKFYLPEDKQLIKAGVEVTVGDKTVKFYADKVSARNEFSYAIDFGSLTGVEVKARSFVEYKDGGKQKIAYSNTTMTQNI